MKINLRLFGGRSAGSGGSRGGGGSSSAAASTHPQINDINYYGEIKVDPYDLAVDGEAMGMSPHEALESAQTIVDYTGSAYHDIHSGSNKAGNDAIDRWIENPNSPVYTGPQYRGMEMSMADANAILSKGVYAEKGATSFSAKKSVAEVFAGIWSHKYPAASNVVHVMVQYNGGKRGMPIKHMSKCTNEDEVLHSGASMKKGFNITSYKWAAGNKELYITVDD